MKEKPIDVKTIFSEALEKKDAKERADYLNQACGNDMELRSKVEALLKAHEEAGDFLNAPPFDADVTLNTSPLTEGPGTIIGRYKLLEQIGEGGFGVVYMAEQQEPIRRRVALKIIKLGMDTRQVIARFEAERQALAMMDHPNIAGVLDAGATETGRPYFVMELVKGIPITEYCDKNNLDTQQRLELFIDVCKAVQHAHQKGIIHRDIKPSNVMITLHDGKPVPKVIDFGIAKATSHRLTEKTLFTKYAQMIGTPEYMSPEQAEMSGLDIDTRTDIYSLGVLLYELLTSATPFDAKELREAGYIQMQRIIRETEPLRPSTKLNTMGDALTDIAKHRDVQPGELCKLVRGDLDWIAMKSLEKDRTRRYETANELAMDIQRHLSNEPVEASPPSTMYRIRKFVQRNRRTVAAVVTIAATLIIGLVVSTTMYFVANRARKSEAVAHTQAEQAKVIAEQAEKVAQEQKNIAETKAEDLRRSSYVNSIQLADSKYQEGNIRRVRELLDSCPNDLRGWEWNRLNYISDQSLMTLRGHRGWVFSIAVSPDGKHIVSGAYQEIKVWDIVTAKELITIPKAYEGYVHCVSFSPDGKHIISSGQDKTIKVWDGTTGAEQMTLAGHTDEVLCATFSPDGKRIVSGGYDRDIRSITIKLWDALSGAELVTIAGGLCADVLGEMAPSSVAFSPDGKRIVSGGKVTKVWDVNSGDEVMALNEGSPVLYSPDGKSIVSCKGNEMRIFDATTGSEMMTLRGHDGPIDSISFSPDNKYISSGSLDNTIKVWDTATGENVLTLRGHEYFVTSIAFTPDGKQIVSGSWDGTIKVWDVTVDRELTRLAGHRSLVSSIAFSPDGKRIVSGSEDGMVKLWDTGSCAELMTLRSNQEELYKYLVAFSPDGRYVASGGFAQTFKIWDVATGAEMMTFHGHKGSIESVAFSPDGKHIASGSDDKTLKVWDASSGKELMTLKGHGSGVLCVAFSPDGKFLASGSFDPTIKVWEVATGRECLTLRGHGGIITSVAFSPDGKRIVSSCQGDSTVKLWDAITGTELMTLKHADVVISAAFSPDGKRIVSGCRDRTARVWDATTGAELLTLRAESGVTIAAFSPDGKTISAGTFDGRVVLWESATPTGRYQPGINSEAARKVVDELYQKCGHYYEVINKLQADTGLDETIRKLALQIASSRKSEDVEKLIKESMEVVNSPGGDPNVYRAALEKVERASRLEPNNVDILCMLGVAQYCAGKFEDAFKTQTKVHGLEPNAPPILAGLGEAQYYTGQYEDAVKTLTKMLEISRRLMGEQDWSTLRFMNQLAWVEATCPAAEFRNGAEAVKNATRACELTEWKKAQYVDTLAAAYSEVGDFESAVKWQKKAISLLTKEDPAEWPAEFDGRLKLYQSGKPYREWEYADILEKQSWSAVRSPDGNEATYREALNKAQKAVSLRPDDWTLLDTLGAAQYRVGAYEDALETLKRSERIRLSLFDSPCWDNLPFTAMTLHRLGRTNEAKSTLAQLRTLLKDERFADNWEAKALLAEAEKLIEGEKK